MSGLTLLDAITAAHDGDIQMIDSTSIRAHQQAATAKRGIEIIVSVAARGGLTTKNLPDRGRARLPKPVQTKPWQASRQ